MMHSKEYSYLKENEQLSSHTRLSVKYVQLDQHKDRSSVCLPDNYHYTTLSSP